MVHLKAAVCAHRPSSRQLYAVFGRNRWIWASNQVWNGKQSALKRETKTTGLWGSQNLCRVHPREPLEGGFWLSPNLKPAAGLVARLWTPRPSERALELNEAWPTGKSRSRNGEIQGRLPSPDTLKRGRSLTPLSGPCGFRGSARREGAHLGVGRRPLPALWRRLQAAGRDGAHRHPRTRRGRSLCICAPR